MESLRAPAAVVGIIAAMAAAFAVGGPRAAMPVAAALILAIIIVAVRQKPFESISPPAPPDSAAHVLVVASAPAEDVPTARKVADKIAAAAARFEERWPDRTEVVVLAPARIGFADRWASDVSRARDQAQRNLVLTVASLAKAGVEAEARVGDADAVQAVEDHLRSFPATDVILITGADDDDNGDDYERVLAERLTVPLTRVTAA